ncbi:hypothetical protein CCM_02801 [Cordyceps militaris CM01]|uniref:Uncharacterized protein n=1 Tax=Cordyceps militaris (strain CM01) TaxID=983644 RepID=G3JBV7_CORMM|nr:uncharacterized protein CCM_02801 [Cordyceps militaris CM01]EGX94530.1 hypothetical protein CCM_02801 [Cordyceps militaris CM01]
MTANQHRQFRHWPVTKKRKTAMHACACMLQSEINTHPPSQSHTLNLLPAGCRWPVNGRLADPVASATSTTPSTAPITTTPDSIANPGRNSSSQLQWLASAPCGLALEPKTRPHGRERTPSARWWAGGWPLQVRPLPAPPMHPKSATQNPEKESCMPKREEETWVADLVFVDPSTLSGRFDSC